MDEAFWHERWAKGEIAFHEGRPNRLLARHLPRLGLRAEARVFVPLCGKAHDLLWLVQQGFTVVGAELSPLAVEELFAAFGRNRQTRAAGALRRVEADALTVFVGNVFDLDAATLGPVDAVYDRAALVALPEAMRRRYAGHLSAVTGGAPQLLVTFEYDPAQPIAPPFSVDEREVRALYGGSHRPTLLERCPVQGGLKGVEPAHAAAWLLEPVA
jgi:thiopurine S-methyltransferase